MSGGPPHPLSATVELREPVRLARIPALAAAASGHREARGLPRVRRKLARALFRLLHWRLRLPLRGVLMIDSAGRVTRFEADFANTGYLDALTRPGSYEPEVSALLLHLAPRLRCVYDIGANWGYFCTLLATDPAFAGRVEAFEISPRNFRDLSALIEAAGLAENVHAHAHGLSDQPGTLAISDTTHSYLTHVAPSGRGRRVPVTSLDALNLPDPDLIKIDVEGHEAHVFRGGLKRLERAKPLIVFESWFSPTDAAAMLEPMRMLERLNYRFLRMTWTATSGRFGRLDLVPLRPEERPEIAQALNLLAVHEARQAELEAAFAS